MDDLIAVACWMDELMMDDLIAGGWTILSPVNGRFYRRWMDDLIAAACFA